MSLSQTWPASKKIDNALTLSLSLSLSLTRASIVTEGTNVLMYWGGHESPNHGPGSREPLPARSLPARGGGATSLLSDVLLAGKQSVLHGVGALDELWSHYS